MLRKCHTVMYDELGWSVKWEVPSGGRTGPSRLYHGSAAAKQLVPLRPSAPLLDRDPNPLVPLPLVKLNRTMSTEQYDSALYVPFHSSI